MQAKQYEERILKLQDALEMQKLKNTSQLGRIRTLEDQLQQTQVALEEERNEKEIILKNRRTNRLLLELQEERVQRLQDLEEIYAKDKQLEALVGEVGTITKGVLEAREEITHKDAEVVGLRASLRVSAKLIQKAERDFMETHRELEATQIKLLDSKRKASEKEAEVRVWIERYEQVMLDLHVAQARLTQLARDATSKDAALMRGYAVDLEKSTGDVTNLKPRPFQQLVDVGASDRAVRKFRQDLIPNRSKSLTAVTSLVRHATHSGELPLASAINPKAHEGSGQRDRDRDRAARDSRECFQCTEPGVSQLHKPTKHPSGNNNQRTRTEADLQQRSSGSKYLGYGLGLLKKDHIVPTSDA